VYHWRASFKGGVMIIGILETGRPPRALQPGFGTYPDMFEALLGPGHDYRVFDVQAGALPDPDARFDGHVITGSPAGAYDDLPWIAPLEDFLRAVKGRTPLVGVCFGHQIMAQAFGGRVEKSARGWGVGLQTYEMTAREAWMDSAAPIAIPVSHQDQVVEAPSGARVIGGNDFNPFGVLAYEGAISMQCHPEFAPAYATALIEARAEQLGSLAAPAVHSLQGPNDCARVGGWIRQFLAQGG
jgi:GMP synthase-like glutamine amidotransferase